MLSLVRTSPRFVAVLAAASLIAAACGGDGGDGGGESEGGDDTVLVHGTTDPPVAYDPAGAYDLPSWNVIYNVYGLLLTIPPGGNTPEPALAESCDYENPKTYTCTLQADLKFSDGSDLTAEDVKFSFDRNIKIADPNGASSLLANLKETEVVDDQTVTFHLKSADATWPFILTTGTSAIVPSDVYPADDLQPDDAIVGAGPYEIAEYRPGEQTVLQANPEYFGEAPPTKTVIIQQFDKSSALKLSIEQGDVQIAYRSLTPTEIEDLRGAEGLQVVEGNGTEIRYLVFNLKLEPGNELAVRRAVAQTIDRQAIVDNVYNGTVLPLYSMVPEGLEGHIDAFADEYGKQPDVEAARKTLADAGIKTPVQMEVWWTPSHYGDSSADEYAEIQRSLESSGLFEVTLKSTEWDQYTEAYPTDQYPVFQLGWFPDFPDADNYLASFYASTSFMNIHYRRPTVDGLVSQERASTNKTKRIQAFEELQRIGARDVPTIPIWQGKQVAIVQDGVTGVEDTFDPSFIFRYWVISGPS
jgi:peptide/nickel transport system substrate-binding protein